MNTHILSDLAASIAEGPVALLLGRGMARSTTAREMCRQLEGRSLQLDAGSDAMAAFFTVTDGELQLRPGYMDEPDATLTGTPLSMARLSAPDPAAVMREGAVSVGGDSDVAEQFQYLFSLLRPDWEEELSKVTGDVVAHEIGAVVRGFGSWARLVRNSLGRSLSEYLTEESAALATATEIEEFCSEVDELASAADRLEARLNNFRQSPSVE